MRAVTEADSRTKPCIGSNPYNTGLPVNPDNQGLIIYVCRGAGCLAWRWDAVRPPENQIGPSDLPGHCGLAGPVT